VLDEGRLSRNGELQGLRELEPSRATARLGDGREV
jgi:hypothetical protein